MYNGHPSYNYWNVALWIGNDEGLYRLALSCIRRNGTRRQAAEEFRSYMESDKTPDGAPWTIAAIQHGMRGLS